MTTFGPHRRRSSGAGRVQRGAATVEIALTFFTFIVILIGVVELVRALWLWTVLGEATRRGARVAAVCDVNDPAIYRAVAALPIGLSPSNVTVEYDYLPAADPASPASAYATVSCGLDSDPCGYQRDPPIEVVQQIRAATSVFVRVGITGFNPPVAFLFPWDTRDEQGRTILAPTDAFLDRYFQTTLPAESLGWNPGGGVDQRGAFEPCP